MVTSYTGEPIDARVDGQKAARRIHWGEPPRVRARLNSTTRITGALQSRSEDRLGGHLTAKHLAALDL
jgi:hypothetical protein